MTTDSAHVESGDREFIYDPVEQPELFDSVRRRRVIAYLFDLVFISVLVLIFGAIVAVLGVLTLGLGWLIYGFLVPLTAILYVAFTLGGPNAATPGMRIMGLEMRLWYGAKPYMVLAIMHGLLFYAFNVLFTPLIILVSLFGERKRLLHDMILGTVVINAGLAPETDRDGTPR